MLIKLLRRFDTTFSVKDYYKVLEVTPTATKTEIRGAYLKLAKQYHPDSQTGNEEKFKQLGEAWSVLSNEKSRAEYNALKSEDNKHSDNNLWDSPIYSQTYDYRNSSYNDPFVNWNKNYQASYESRFEGFYKEQDEKNRKNKRKTAFYEYYNPRTGRRVIYSFTKTVNCEEDDDQEENYYKGNKEFDEIFRKFQRKIDEDWNKQQRKKLKADFFTGVGLFFITIVMIYMMLRLGKRKKKYENELYDRYENVRR